MLKIIFILFLIVRLSQQTNYGNISLTIDGIYLNSAAYNFIKNVTPCDNCWLYDLQILLMTPNQLCGQQTSLQPNTTSSFMFNCQFEDPVFMTAYFSPSVKVVSQIVNYTVTPKESYCPNGINETFPINVYLNSSKTTATICNNTRIVYSYTYACLQPGYYPPSCVDYCVAMQTTEACYNCTSTGKKKCCSGFEGDNCTQVTTSTMQPTTNANNNTTTSGTSSKEHTYFIAMIAMSVVAGILLIMLIILGLIYCLTKNSEPENEPPPRSLKEYTNVKPMQKPRPVIRVTEASEEVVYPTEERRDIGAGKYSVHSDSSEELDYFGQPWNQNVARNYDVVANSQPQMRATKPKPNVPSRQRFSDESQTFGYQNPQDIHVLDEDEYDSRAMNNSRRHISGTYI